MTYFQLFAIPVFLFTLYLAIDENGVGIFSGVPNEFKVILSSFTGDLQSLIICSVYTMFLS